MGRRGRLGLAAAATVLLSTAPTGDPSAAPKPPRVAMYAVYEHSFDWRSTGDANLWEAVDVAVTLTSPHGRRTTIGGFYAGGNTWKFRFAPNERGRWRWTAALRDSMHHGVERGTFIVRRGRGDGPVRTNPYNRFRWTFADGTPYYPLGIDDCVRDRNGSGSPFDEFYVDDTHGAVDVDAYLATYQRAGVNLFRWSVDNCAFGLYRTIGPGGNVYLQREGEWGDRLARALRAHGYRIYMTIFGGDPPYAKAPTGPQLDAIKRYIKYVADRYGAYVDYWELMNEATASTAWYVDAARYLRSVDPYRHPIATSWERPDLNVIDVNAPHWYERESELDSDTRTWYSLNGWKAAGKPVIVGEQGNSGQNWDEHSALRMRIRAWTAFFAEGTLIFWNTSSTRRYHAVAANMYLGSEERGYLRALRRYVGSFDARSRMVTVRVSSPLAVRAYGLLSPRLYGVYFRAASTSATTSGAQVAIPARPGVATWFDPATGRVVRKTVVRSGTQRLLVPTFRADIALKIRFGAKRG